MHGLLRIFTVFAGIGSGLMFGVLILVSGQTAQALSWLPIILIIGIALVWIGYIVHQTSRYIRAREIEQQRCPTCGYDLRGSPRQCPECGWIRPRIYRLK